MPKFVSWIPTQSDEIAAFFELAPVASSDIVFDLGCGDGRLLFAALERGAGKCVGIDIDPERIRVAENEAHKRGIDGRVTFIQADVMEVDLSEASVILCYLVPEASAALRPKFERELKPGTKVVMESFPVLDWKPEKIKEVDYKAFYLYTMPPEKTDEHDIVIYTRFQYVDTDSAEYCFPNL